MFFYDKVRFLSRKYPSGFIKGMFMYSFGSFRSFSSASLMAAGFLFVSGNANALGLSSAEGKIFIQNDTDCTLQLDSGKIKESNGVAQYEDEVIAPGMTSKPAKFILDVGAYAQADAGAVGQCSVQGEGEMKYWTIIAAGQAKGRFESELSCMAGVSALVKGGLGILPDAYATIYGNAKDSVSNMFRVLINRVSNEGIVVSSGLSNPQVCGDDKGFYKISHPKSLIGDKGTASIKFSPYTVIISNANDDSTLIAEVVNSKLKLQFDSSNFPVSTLKSPQVENVSYSSEGAYSGTLSATVENKYLGKFIFRKNISVNSILDFSKLHLCSTNSSNPADIDSYVIYPTIEHPTCK